MAVGSVGGLVKGVDYLQWSGYNDPTMPPMLTTTGFSTGAGFGKRTAYLCTATTNSLTTPFMPLMKPGSNTFTGFRLRWRWYADNWSSTTYLPGNATVLGSSFLNPAGAQRVQLLGYNGNYGATGSRVQFNYFNNNGGNTAASYSPAAVAGAWQLCEIQVSAAGNLSFYWNGALVQTVTDATLVWAASTSTQISSSSYSTYAAEGIQLSLTGAQAAAYIQFTDIYYTWL